MKEYLENYEEVLKAQNSSDQGLSTGEAEKRLAQYGKNKLKEAKKDSILKRFLKELSDPMILILIAAAIISGITAFYQGESFADVIIIIAVVINQRRSRRSTGRKGRSGHRSPSGRSQPHPVRSSVTERSSP